MCRMLSVEYGLRRKIKWIQDGVDSRHNIDEGDIGRSYQSENLREYRYAIGSHISSTGKTIRAEAIGQ